MQSFTIILSALCALTGQAVAAPHKAAKDVAARDAMPLGCKITGDGVNYRTCPSTNDDECPALGQYFEGDEVTFSCWTGDSENNR
jgi:hypothetical protein